MAKYELAEAGKAWEEGKYIIRRIAHNGRPGK